MYNIIIPTVVTSPSYNREGVLSEIKRAGASRVLLAIGAIHHDKGKNEAYLDILRSDIPYFRENGFEVGVWLWGLMMTGESPFTKVTGFRGEEKKQYMCPADKDFVAFMQDFIRKVTALSPDLILLDDDVRFGNLGDGFGCVCEHHLKMMSDILKEDVQREGLYEKMFSGKPNKYRSAFLKACGKSLEDYCKSLRDAVDSVNPNVRLGLCACISNYDTDGTDAHTMARILAGNTKPYLRQIGAPYWAVNKSWGHRLPDVIEYERQQRSRFEALDMEIVPEGDPYPRPRYNVPSAYLEMFDSALRVSGGFNGIQKYMVDYNSTTFYETEYINRHNANKPLYDAVDGIFGGKDAVGIRIYEPLKKLENADFTHRRHNIETIPDMAFSRAFRMTTASSIPTVHTGSGICGISFGENIRAYIGDGEIFKKPLIIDLPAARILTEYGIDVGIKEFLGESATIREYFIDQKEYVPIRHYCEKVTLNEKAHVLSVNKFADGSESPAAYTYETTDGARLLVYTFDAQLSAEGVYRNYSRPKQLISVMQGFGVEFPSIIHDCPDLYVITKKDKDGNMAIGLWNCFADGVYDKEIILDGVYSEAEILNASIEHHGDRMLIKKLGAFEFCFINLKK